MSKPIVRFIISDTPMGLSHDGLSEVIKDHKKKNKLFAQIMKNDGGLVLFVNRARDRIKLFSDDGTVIGYLRLPRRMAISAETVDLIPQTFGGSIEYARAVKSAFSSFLAQESKRESPINKTVLLQASG